MLEYLKREFNTTTTENGAFAYETTNSYTLDCFARIGAMRNSEKSEILKTFYTAFIEDRLLAVKMLFWNRDIRGGNGERRVFRILLNDLAKNHPNIVRKNIELVSEYGRWDDLFVLFDTPCEKDMIDLIERQLKEDEEAKYPSLLSKWMPSINTSSMETIRLGKRMAKALNLSEKEYRKKLSKNRAKINIIERLMSAGRWEDIEFNKITSKNMIQYTNALKKHQLERFNEYLEKVKSGETKINTGALYPYEIVAKALRSSDETWNIMWEKQKNEVEGLTSNSLCVVDVSGSMTFNRIGGITPLEVALSLGLYTAERLEGAFKNHFLTFSARPRLQEIIGNNLHEKLINMERANWGVNTNLIACFDLILEVALKNNIPSDEMIERLIIISDMEFDSAISGNKRTIFEEAKRTFEGYGYKLPTIVFWNVDSRNKAMQINSDYNNVLLVSGLSPAILKGVLKYGNPMELVLETLNCERYNKVTI